MQAWQIREPEVQFLASRCGDTYHMQMPITSFVKSDPVVIPNDNTNHHFKGASVIFILVVGAVRDRIPRSSTFIIYHEILNSRSSTFRYHQQRSQSMCRFIRNDEGSSFVSLRVVFFGKNDSRIDGKRIDRRNRILTHITLEQMQQLVQGTLHKRCDISAVTL